MSAFDNGNENHTNTKVGEEFEVLFDWTPENPEDLQLIAGETITVLEQNSHGWWLGVAIRGEAGLQKGYFPKNYVRAKNVPPTPPPRPSNISKAPSTSEEDAKPPIADNRISRKLNTNFIPESVSASKRQSFSLKSLKAYDDLMENGISIEIESRESESSPDIVLGLTVELQCSAFIWDGASTDTTEFSNGIISFAVGEEKVTAGLDLAVQQLKAGDQAIITCGPNLAYGAAGYPPSVPPNSFIVYKVKVLSAKSSFISGSPIASSSSSVPSELLNTGVASRQSIRFAASSDGQADKSNRRGSKLVLVDSPAALADLSGLSLKEDINKPDA